jgi:acetyl-CoA carboxylase biotin carboxylase subunit
MAKAPADTARDGGKAPLKRVLVANRGEIAVRIIRACRELGMQSVAVFSDADEHGMARQMADVAVRLPGKTSAETYLNVPAVIDAVRRSGADAVHPGYGFLSENEGFAAAVAATGAKFVGPPPRAMELMGNKIEARELMKKHGVPVVPGATHALADTAELQKLAREIGYPLILKAAAGGGGRGMRVVRTDAELEPAFSACQREAQAYFGNPDVFCERYIEQPRHIEFQVLFDAHGNGVHLFERDCSVQRRHQKLLEEAPSAFLDAAQREALGAKAVAAARAAGYEGAGTIEFICESPDKAYFMEMNTRIQVEHPVTELVTGVDLIAWQLRIAGGEKLAFTQADIKLHGWAFEARINAEDPSRDFAASPGRVAALRLPQGPGVRVDTHLYPGYEIPEFYDSMVAKLIVWDSDRPRALARLARALGELKIEGVPTTARFHEALLEHPEFRAGRMTTRFIEENSAYFAEQLAGALPPGSEARRLAALVAAVAWLEQQQTNGPQPNYEPSRWLDAARMEQLR